MPIDIAKALGASVDGPDYAWTEDDIILYQLGIGAGFDPVDPAELKYVYEGDLRVLPSFASIPPFATMFAVIADLGVNLAHVLHGEQETVIHRQIPTAGAVSNHGTVTGIFDKGKGALVVTEIVSRSRESDEPMFTNRSSLFIRGEGGFGGDPGPAAAPDPTGEPDLEVVSPTLAQQALIYRLSGDRNPLHADPGFAAFAGYERPILHGLCSYGVVAKAAVESALGGDPTRVKSYRARFSGVVFPGETLVTKVWKSGDRLLLSATTRERGLPVISGGAITTG